MKKNTLLIGLFPVFFALGCFGTTWVKSALFKQDLNRSGDSSNLIAKPLDDSLLPTEINGFVISTRNTSADNFLKEMRGLSLDEILQMEDADRYEMLIEDYFRSVPVDEIGNALIQISKIDTFEHSNYREVFGLYIGFSIWIKRDFESAKAFALDYSPQHFMQSEMLDARSMIFNRSDPEKRYSFLSNSPFQYVLSEIAATELIKEWVKRDKNSCLEFIRNQSESGNRFYGTFFVNEFINDNPEDIFQLSEENPELFGHDTVLYLHLESYSGLFRSWYVKNPTVALAKASTIKDRMSRWLAMQGILDSMSIEHPEQALALVKKEFNNEGYYIRNVIRGYAEKADKSAVMDLIRQGSFPAEERNWMYHGLVESMDCKDMKMLLDAYAGSMTADEVEYLVKAKFGSREGLSFQLMVFSSYMGINDDLESVKTLLNLISDDSKEALVTETIKDNDHYFGNEWIFEVYKSLSDEKINKSEALHILNRCHGLSPTELITFYMERIHGNEKLNQEPRNIEKNVFNASETEAVTFVSILQRYMDQDGEGARQFINSLSDPILRQQGEFAIIAKDLDGEDTKIASYFESLEDKELREYGLKEITSRLSHDNPQALASILKNLTDTGLAETILKESASRITDTSEDVTLDFIKELSENEEMHTLAQEKFYEQSICDNPRLALEIAVDMPPRPETDKKVKQAWKQFKFERPKAAEAWARGNGISFEE